jgi:DNA adenine methylase
MNSDFEDTIANADKNDFIFLDPPYKPGEKDMLEYHYSNGQFFFDQQVRLAETLKKLPKSKNIRWAMTNSSHKDILKLYKGFNINKIAVGTGTRPGIHTHQPNEVIITNY